MPGYNQYDGFMLGALIHNINLPENKFEFLFTPLYAFGSKTGRVSEELVIPGIRTHTSARSAVGLNGGHFNTNKATDSTGQLLYLKIFQNWYLISDLISNHPDPRSTISKWMDFKTYLITEQIIRISFSFLRKILSFIRMRVSTDFRYVNQLSFNLQDNRALYPYDFRVEFQQSELFYRINLHADYFLNYPDGGGLQVRFFAAKFGVWNENNNAFVARYEPKLLGVDGNEDYLYEDYFIGRSATYALENSFSIPMADWPPSKS